MLISISGKARHGKDSVADVLVRDFKYVKVSFADALRFLCSQVFDMPLEQFLDDDKKERSFTHPIRLDEEHLGHILSVIENTWAINVSKESKDKMLTKVGLEMKHPRNILQTIGSEVVRDCIADDFWIRALEKKIENLADVVISDARLQNEREWAKSKGALLCIVERPNFQTSADSHRSENELGNTSDYNIQFINDDSLNRFRIEVNSFFNSYFKRPRY